MRLITIHTLDYYYYRDSIIEKNRPCSMSIGFRSFVVYYCYSTEKSMTYEYNLEIADRAYDRSTAFRN